MSFLELLDRIHNANLTGYALMLVMLACFLVGAIATRLAIELDAKALWRLILSRKPTPKTDEEPKEAEHE